MMDIHRKDSTGLEVSLFVVGKVFASFLRFIVYCVINRVVDNVS